MATAATTPTKPAERKTPDSLPVQFREVVLERIAPAEGSAAEEYELTFSTETPVQRWYGMEILDHDPKSVRMKRLNAGAPLLVNHDSDRHVGVVVEKSARMEGGKGRATVRFG